jgi:hypothetical protein
VMMMMRRSLWRFISLVEIFKQHKKLLVESHISERFLSAATVPLPLDSLVGEEEEAKLCL